MLLFFNFWALFGLGLFYLGPIPWEGAERAPVAVLVLCCLAAFNLAALSIRDAPVLLRAQHSPLDEPVVRYAAILVYIALSYLHLKTLTGLSIFSPSDYSLEFGDIYANYSDTLQARQRSGLVETLLMLSKAALFPVILLILIRGFKSQPFSTSLIFFPFFASSMMRGTDKEFFDIGILLLVLGHYHGVLRRRFVLMVSVVPVVLLFFLERKIGRFEGFMPPCLPNSVVCFDLSSSLADISPSLEVLYVMGANYLTQGYQGLDLAFGVPFEANFGLGHLPPLKRVLCDSFMLACDLGDFQARLSAIGWDARTNWVSVYTVLANDLHWLFVPVYFAALGFVFRVSEVNWRRSRDPQSLGALIIIALFMIYASANMQVAISMDWVFATGFLLYGQLARILAARRVAVAYR